MKIKPEHYDFLKTVIGTLPRDKMQAHKENLKHDARVKDQAKRFRWDLLYALNISPWLSDNLYGYLDDTHLDTALRSIVRELDL